MKVDKAVMNEDVSVPPCRSGGVFAGSIPCGWRIVVARAPHQDHCHLRADGSKAPLLNSRQDASCGRESPEASMRRKVD